MVSHDCQQSIYETQSELQPDVEYLSTFAHRTADTLIIPHTIPSKKNLAAEAYVPRI
jgi:hypothetical protein